MDITQEFTIEIELDDVKEIIRNKLLEKELIYSTTKIEFEWLNDNVYVVRVTD